MKILIAALLFILNTFDFAATWGLVKIDGIMSELNPMMRIGLEKFGIWTAIPKIGAGIFLAILIYVYWERYKFFRVGSCIILILYGAVAVVHMLNMLI